MDVELLVDQAEYWYDFWESHVSLGPDKIVPDVFGVARGSKKMLLDRGYSLQDCIAVAVHLTGDRGLRFLFQLSQDEIDSVPIDVLDYVVTEYPSLRTWPDPWASSNARSWQDFKSLMFQDHSGAGERSLLSRVQHLVSLENTPADRYRMVNAIFDHESPVLRGRSYMKRHDNVRAATLLMNHFMLAQMGGDPAAFNFGETLTFLCNHGAVLLQSSNLVPSVLFDFLFQIGQPINALPFVKLGGRKVLDVLLRAAREEDLTRNFRPDSALMTCCKALVLCAFEGLDTSVHNCLYSIMRLLQPGCDPQSQNDEGQTARNYLETLNKQGRLPIILGFRQVSFDKNSEDKAWRRSEKPLLTAIGMLKHCEQSQDEGQNVHQALNTYLEKKYPEWARPEWVHIDEAPSE